jgi:hypothetical protein
MIFGTHFIPEPVITLLTLTTKQIDFMITKDRLRSFCLDQTPNERHDTGTVGTTITQVSDKDQLAALGVGTIVSITQMV